MDQVGRTFCTVSTTPVKLSQRTKTSRLTPVPRATPAQAIDAAQKFGEGRQVLHLLHPMITECDTNAVPNAHDSPPYWTHLVGRLPTNQSAPTANTKWSQPASSWQRWSRSTPRYSEGTIGPRTEACTTWRQRPTEYGNFYPDRRTLPNSPNWLNELSG